MAQSDKKNRQDHGASFMKGPKPLAPIPRYEPGSDDALRDRLNSTSATSSFAPVDIDADGINVAGIEGMIDRKKANVAAKIVDTDPDQALRIIRNWLLQE
ncbi:hypothetical protein TH30_04140 [Thalassospira profundimaris]|uniref:Uncharacterized protein n=2 Tax=Thalassospiraceae TaxID=2844866 RepID=A0A367X8Q1_9PROT|nr:hypothetical protein TH30_04140 [Thalassospira profundimaris]